MRKEGMHAICMAAWITMIGLLICSNREGSMKTIIYFRISPNMSDICHELQAIGIDVYENSSFFSFRIDKDSESYSSVLRIVEAAVSKGGSIREKRYEVEYTENDCATAKYLYVRSSFEGFVHDFYAGYEEYLHRNGSKTFSFGQKRKQIDVYEHLVQRGLTRTDKCPVWKTTRQFRNGLTATRLFCSDSAKKIIEESGLIGAEFTPVLSCKTKMPMDDLWQLCPAECEIAFKPGKHITCRPCPVCGKTRLIPEDARAELVIRDGAIPADLDFVQTPPSYGVDCGVPLIIISNKAYHVLKQANIARALVFTPIKVTT